MAPPKHVKEKNTTTSDLQQEPSGEVKTDDDVEVDEVSDYNSAFGSFTSSTVSSMSAYTHTPSHEMEEFNDWGSTFSRTSSSRTSVSSFSTTQPQTRRNWKNWLFGPSDVKGKPTSIVDKSIETIMIGNWGGKPSWLMRKDDGKRLLMPQDKPEVVSTAFDHRGYDGIKRIIIYCYSFAIYSMRIQYTKGGKLEWSKTVGERDVGDHRHEAWSERVGERDGGDRRHEIVLDDPREYITKIKGHFHFFYGVKSLTFFTNRETYGPFGIQQRDDSSEDVHPFEYSGGKLVGFKGLYGRAYVDSSIRTSFKAYIYSIGFYVQSPPPQSCEKCGGNYIISSATTSTSERVANVNHQTTREIQQIISVRQFGLSESGFRPFDHGGGYDGIKRIFVGHRGEINYLEVEYTKNGEPQLTDGIGDVNMKDSATEVVLDYPNEFLQAVTGTYGPFGVSCLTFHSNLKKYGPFGATFGFPFEVSRGKIVGFQGEASEYALMAIGFHVVPTKYPICLLCDTCKASS